MTSDLHSALKAIGLTQKKAASATGYSRDAVVKTCAGRGGPTRDALNLLLSCWPHLPDDARAILLNGHGRPARGTLNLLSFCWPHLPDDARAELLEGRGDE